MEQWIKVVISSHTDFCFYFYGLFNKFNNNVSRSDCILSLNRTQSRVVIGLLTGHNIFRRHLYIMGLSNNPTCRKCGNKEETSVHILCECEALASLRHTYLGSFILDPEDIRDLGMGAIWNFAKGTELL